MWPLLIAVEEVIILGKLPNAKTRQWFFGKQTAAAVDVLFWINAYKGNPNYEILSGRHLVYEILGFEAQISTSDAGFLQTNTT